MFGLDQAVLNFHPELAQLLNQHQDYIPLVTCVMAITVYLLLQYAGRCIGGNQGLLTFVTKLINPEE